MQPVIKQSFIVILLIFCIVAFSGSYAFLNIDNLAFVVALGLDVSETNNVKVTFQFVNLTPNNEGSNNDSKIIIDSVDASSVPNAINIMNAYLDKKVDLSHCKTIVFSEELAKKDITNYIYSLMNDIQVRPSSNVIVSKCDAKDYMKNSEPSLETSIVKFYQNFPKSSKYTGYVSDTTIGDFFNSLVCNYCEAHSILGGLKSSETNSTDTADLSQTNSNIKSGNSPITAVRRTENFGIAVFKHGTFVGELDVIETACYHMLQHDVNTFLISVPNPEKEGYLIDVYIIPKSQPKIDVSIVNGTPYIKVDCKLSAKLASISEHSEYLNENVLDSISTSCDNYLSSNLRDFLYKTSLYLKSDVNGLGRYASSHFVTNKEFEDFDWKNSYSNSTFDVNVKTNIDSSYFLTQT